MFTRDRYSPARVYIHMQMDKCTNWLMSREPVLSRGEWLPVRKRRDVDIALVSLCKGSGSHNKLAYHIICYLQRARL